MASGSQGKPAPASNGGGIFANGLPSIAALARSAGRLTASHFVSSSSSQKKAQRQQQAANGAPTKNNNNNNNNTNGSNCISKQHQAAYWGLEHANHMKQQAQGQPEPLAGRLRSASQNQCELEHHQHAYAINRRELEEEDDDDAVYADQLRRGQLHQRLQQQQQQQQQHQQQQTHHYQANQSQQQPIQQHRRHSTNEPAGQRAAKSQQHVNFGQRASQSGRPGDEPDEDLEGESSRKKKYLTAKYGAQQMNLIKKRLKVEMWLHERLQELTSKSRALGPEELEELDIDLDQLLDLEDEATRKQHLRKLLAPLDDLPAELVDSFICDVLEQSKLL